MLFMTVHERNKQTKKKGKYKKYSIYKQYYDWWYEYGNMIFSVLLFIKVKFYSVFCYFTLDKFVLFGIIRRLTDWLLMASNHNTSGYKLVLNFRSCCFSYYRLPSFVFQDFSAEGTTWICEIAKLFCIPIWCHICNSFLWWLYSCLTHVNQRGLWLSACCDDVTRHVC